VASLIVALTTLDLDPYTILLLWVYVALGVLSAWKRIAGLYFLFGSKTHGSLMLALGCLEISEARTWLLNAAVSLRLPVKTTMEILLFEWAVFAIIVHIIGEIYNVKTRRDRFGQR